MALMPFLKELLSQESVSPYDAQCQTMIADKLRSMNFLVESMPCQNVSNLWAVYGTKGPLLCYLGHTDVVPSGDHSLWDSPPFCPTERDGYLYARGVADMKGSVAAMLMATQAFLKETPKPPFRIAFLITSDEEGPALFGTKHVIKQLKARGEKIDWCLVGEPSSEHKLGDTLKNGRRGSANFSLNIQGKQGHVAYPQLANNAAHLGAKAITALSSLKLDKGNADFPASNLEVSNVRCGEGVSNVIPGQCHIDFNIRFNPLQTFEGLKSTIERCLEEHKLKYEMEGRESGRPFITPKESPLITATIDAIKSQTGLNAKLSRSGGTSDGRFIAPTGSHVLEFGLINATIHQINESTKIEDLHQLQSIYQQILSNLSILNNVVS